MLTADIAFWPIVAFMVGCSLYFRALIKSSRMAMQWGLDGKPTWTMSTALGVWTMVAIALFIRLLIWFGMTFVPDKVHRPEEGLLLSSIILAVIHVRMLRVAARQTTS